MANIKSAAKRAQIAKVRTLRNKSAMSRVKTTIKAVEAAVEESREAILKITEEAEKTCSAIREQAALKKEEAVKAVIGKVVGEYGSC